ncbi:MAG TPA: flippase [Oscillatoriales bacterium UBA8482]|nr:MAG: O-unit flippase [Oscillatoriales cyanobacterium CG2_30_40_61]HBW58589.1 flippase [Oscillatoriales bacterium UBA8482]
MLKKITKILQEKLQPDQRKAFFNIILLLGERVFRMGVAFIMLAWVARYLGVKEFGELNYALAFCEMFSPLFEIASSQFIFRDLVTYPGLKSEILGTYFWIKTITGVVIFGLTAITIFVLQPDNILTIKLVVILSIPSFLRGFNGIECWFKSQLEMKYTVFIRNGLFILVTLTRIFLLTIQAPLIAFAWLVMIENSLNIVALIVTYKITGNDIFAWRANSQRAKKLMKISFPLIFASLSIVIYMRIDQVMLGQLADAKSVGIYSAAVRLSELWPFTSTIIVQSIAPSIIAAKKVSEELYYQKLQKLSNSQALLVYCIAIPMTFLATPFTVLIFGEEYALAGPILAVHIWSSMFGFLGYVKDIWITTEELTGFAFVFSTAGALINVALNFWLIPHYQGMGAAIATVISYCFADYVMCFLYPPARKFGRIMTQAMTLNLIKFNVK